MLLRSEDAGVEPPPGRPAPPSPLTGQRSGGENENLPPPIAAKDEADESVSMPDPFEDLVGEAVELLQHKAGPKVTPAPTLIFPCLPGAATVLTIAGVLQVLRVRELPEARPRRR